MIELSLITTGVDNHYFTENNISIKALNNLKPSEEGEWDGYPVLFVNRSTFLKLSNLTDNL